MVLLTLSPTLPPGLEEEAEEVHPQPIGRAYAVAPHKCLPIGAGRGRSQDGSIKSYRTAKATVEKTQRKKSGVRIKRKENSGSVVQ